jgi:predicted NBD/HSP70 family sugar kinase
MALPGTDRSLAILQLIRREGHATRRTIAERTGLSVSLVSRLTNELRRQHLIVDTGKSESDGGRPSDLLTLNPDAGYVVGLDIGGTDQRAVVVDLRGAVVASLTGPNQLTNDRQEILHNIERVITEVIAQTELGADAILGLGVGLRAIVDPIRGVVHGWPNTPAWSATWTEFAVRDALAERLRWPHLIVDDTVRAMGIAEAEYGHGSGRQDFIYVLAETGIGAAIMLQGLPYLGPNHISGEIGHMRMTDAALPCKCGNTGCLETLASIPAILAGARRQLAESQMLTALRRKQGQFTITEIIDEAEQGDKLAYQLLTEAGEYLGSALAGVLNLLGPKLVIVGGPLATSNAYLDAARRMIRLRALTQAAQGVVLEPSQLGELAGARGTATLVLSTLFSPHGSNILALRGAMPAARRRPQQRAYV